ncbi:hypothetical protein AK812_SmicGene40059 [Symbiodinium microadriaticum]|uniref:Reverse transcriptase domain-containing protein n=1 Tax=Symbiodinium microadriaticum TaxID=2951 RepID=A0A1Q9C9L7_SYMMI|nr:hypothetical protein AK812_SmicGene40059 [Symbiodinium microadriaticum]
MSPSPGLRGMCFGTKDDKKMMCSMQLQMRVDGLFPPGSYKVMTKKCNYRRRLLRALVAGGAGHTAGYGRCHWDPHALKRRMRLRAIWAARCGKNKSAADDEVSTAGLPEGPSGDEVPRAFPGDLAVGPASCGCWPVHAEESAGEEHADLRSVLRQFELPGQGPSFRFADDEGSVVAAGGQSFPMDEPIQDMPFAGSLVVASKNDDQDPQRAKNCCDGRLTPEGLLETRPEQGQKVVVDGLLSPKERLETRPEKGPRSHEVSFLNPSPDGAPTVSPQRTPTSPPPASQCASHGFESMLVYLGMCAEDFSFDGPWCEDDPVTRTCSKDCPGLSGEMLADNSDDRAQFDLSTVQHGSEAGAFALAVLAYSVDGAGEILDESNNDWATGQAWSEDPCKSSADSGCTLVVWSALQAAHWVFSRLCRLQGISHDATKGTRTPAPSVPVFKGDGWTPVVRKQRSLGDVVLRSQDWNSPILKPSELGAKLDGLADGDTLRGIVLVQSDDEFASISSVLRGCPKPHKMLLLRPSNEAGSQRAPGQVGDRLTFRNLAVATFCSSNSSGEMPQFQGSSGSDAKPLKVKITESAVLYVRLSKLYCDPKLWASFERAAAKEALQWAACRHVQALDSFSWSREKGKAGDSEQFFGLLRVAKKDIGPLLSSSGQQGVFVSAPRGLPDAAACEVAWVDRASKEKPKDYLERVTRMSSAHGLALSNMRLGWRRPLDKDEVPVRVWNVTDVPREWDHCAVADLLGTAFVDPVILSHRWAKKAITYRFKAKVKDGGDRDVAADTPEIPTETVAVPTAKTQDADGKDRHPRILRAELVTHLLKHAYCSMIEKDSTYLGELEIVLPRVLPPPEARISVVDEISNFMECHNLQVCTIAEADINVASAPGYIRAWKLRGFQEDIAEKFDQYDCAPFRAALSQGDVDEENEVSSLRDFVNTALPCHQAQDAAAVKAQWRNLLRDDIGRQRTFVKARADAQLEFEKRVTETHEAKLAGPVHPSVMVREQTKGWVRKWQAQPIVNHDAIDQVLAKVPAVKRTQLDIVFSAEGLCSIAASIAAKAAGPDCWKAAWLCKMPLSWWALAAELWRHIWAHAAVPKLWKDAKVTLIRKKGGPTTRPITLTQIMWRIGAKVVARALREWAPEWASESDHGGLPGRSISDVLFQVQAALRRGTNTAVLMDVAGYFDAMNAQTMKKVFTHLGAPVQLALLLESFYTGVRFEFDGKGFTPKFSLRRDAQGCLRKLCIGYESFKGLKDIREDLEPPTHRGEERLLSKHLREQPLPPPAVDEEGLVVEIADSIREELTRSHAIVIATDGSAKDDVAAHSVVVNNCDSAFFGGNDSEDQSSFRAEMCALKLALEAVLVAVNRLNDGRRRRSELLLARPSSRYEVHEANSEARTLVALRLRLGDWLVQNVVSG